MSTPGELLEALGRQARARLGGGAGLTRTYRGRSVEELIPQIQRDLGAEAIVVRRREGLTGGVLGFFQHAYVEIEAMPGTPAVDVYDEDDSVAPAPAPAPASASASGEGLAPGPGPGPAPASELAPGSRLPASGEPPAPLAQAHERRARPPAASPPAERTAQRGAGAAGSGIGNAPAAPAGAPGGGVSRLRPALGYWPAPASSQPAGAAPAPAPFAPPPAPPAPPAGAGSAYVTAHLAALARANRARSGRRDPSRAAPEPALELRPLARREPAPGPQIARAPAPPPVYEPALRARDTRAREQPERAAGGEQPREPQPWSADYQELSPGELPELVVPVPARRTGARGGDERRTVAPGSHARARAGVARSLRRYGISESLAEELIDAAAAHALALAPRAGLAQGVRATLAQRIPVAPPLPAQGAAIALVGAGGAGKTTCCAVMLGAYRKSSSLPASFATIARDGEREQLRMILSPHILKPADARTPRALRALGRARRQGIVVLDTPSVSPADRAGVRELAALLAELKPDRVVVTLPATLGARAAAQLLQGLGPLGANSMAVTHADETDQIGVAVEAACRFALAPEYVLDRARNGGWRLSRVDPAALAARLLA